MKFVPKKIEEYCVNQSLSDNELLKALSNKTWEKEKIPEMLSGPSVSYTHLTLPTIYSV